VQELFPGTQVTIGPVIENGFFYDFHRAEPFTTEDFAPIEKKMREIIARDKTFTKTTKTREEAKEFFRAKGEAFKVELVDAIPQGQDIKFYDQGGWSDLCRGPHMTSTGKIEGVINLHGRTRGITDAAGAMVSGNAQIQETGLRFTCDPSQR
jgi:threonyl-tRNA synthetase